MDKFKRVLASSLVAMLICLSFLNFSSAEVNANEASVSVQRNFINSIAGSAVSIARAHNLFPSIMIAQAILESDWGRSQLSRPPYYNLFGIKGGSDGIVFDTLEDDGFGNLYGIKDSFRRYNSYLESLQDYAELFRSTPYLTRVYAPFVNSRTVEEACQALTGTYATDTSYGKKLMNIIIGYNLLIYDNEVDRAPSWDIEAKDDYVYSVYNMVNIRSDHSTDSEIIKRAMAGDKFKRLGVTTGWTLIELEDGRKAYIASEYISTQKPDDVYDPVKDGSLNRDMTKDNDEPDFYEEYIKGINGDKNTDKKNDQKDEDKQANPNIPNKDGSVKDMPPPEPENHKTEPNKLSEEEISAAKKAADQAIAEGPSSSTKSGVLDSRTAGVKNETKSDKSKLEGFLGSNVNLPFASEEVKKNYIETLKKAVSLYWNPQAKQQDIDEIVQKLNELREQAEQEDADGLKADNEMLRRIQDKTTGISIAYTKLQINKIPKLSVEVDPRVNISELARKTLHSRGQRWQSYRLNLTVDTVAEAEEAKKMAEMTGDDAPAQTAPAAVADGNGDENIEKSEELTVTEPIKIKIPVPEHFNPNHIEVYYLDDGKIEKIKFSVSDKFVSLKSKNIGTYMILERNMRLQEIKENHTILAADADNLGIVVKPKLKNLYTWELLALLIVLLAVPAIKAIWLKFRTDI